MDPKKTLLIGLVIAAGLAFLYVPGFARISELKSQQAQLRIEVTRLQEENERLQEEARKLREDPDYAEAVARKEMGFVRPGETMIKWKEKKVK